MVKKERSPETKAENLKKSVDIYRKKSKKAGEGKKLEDRARARALRKKMKRAQRKLMRAKILTLEEEMAATERLLDGISKGMDDLKSKGKTLIDPHMHSLSKKSKSLNKRMKQIKRRQEKIKKAEEKAAKAQAAKEEPAKKEEKAKE